MLILKRTRVCRTRLDLNIKLQGQKTLCYNPCEEIHMRFPIRGRGPYSLTDLGPGCPNLLADMDYWRPNSRANLDQGAQSFFFFF